jgi:D-alanine-D-alanine ligase
MGVTGNKYYALRLAEACGIPIGRLWLYLPTKRWAHRRRPDNGARVIVKPALECASIGIDDNAIRTVDENLEDWLETRLSVFRQPLLLQSFVPGYEIEAPVYCASEPLAPAAFGVSLRQERLLGDEILTYDRVFVDDYDYYPAGDLDLALEQRVLDSALTIYDELGLSGFARIDFRVTTQGEHVVTDVNAIPHLTPRSTCVLAFARLGFTYTDVLKLVIAAGLLQERKRL